MPGRPRSRVMLERLEDCTRDAFPDNPDATHLDFVALWQEAGGQINTLADTLSDLPPDDPSAPDPMRRIVSGAMLTQYLKAAFGLDLVNDRLSRAREEGAHRLTDEALTIADNADPDDVNVARLKVSARQWTAEKWNPKEFGRHQNVQVGGSITHLHLAALQNPRALQAPVIADATISPVLSPPALLPAPPITQPVVVPDTYVSVNNAHDAQAALGKPAPEPARPAPRPRKGAKARRPPP